MASTSTTVDSESESKRRYWLAFWILFASFVCIAGISAAAILAAKDEEKATQLVFSSLLPVLGTWVGTVLAFYFARENLKAATDSAVALTRPQGKKTHVSEVMIGSAEITAKKVNNDKEARELLLSDLKQTMESASPPRSRLPILNANGSVLYIVHESTLNKLFAVPNAEAVKPTAPGKVVASPPKAPTKLGELLDVPGYEVLRAFAVVSQEATLAEAREAMAKMPGCNDVFVTADGQATEPILGWLTNSLLAEHT